MNRKVMLSDICIDLSDGLHAAPVFFPNGEYLFVNANNMVNGRICDIGNGKRASAEEYEKYKIELDENTLFYSIDGTIGNVAKYHGEKCILGKGACYIRLKPEICRDYIYYVLQSNLFRSYIKTMQTGSTIHHISLETMRKFSFVLPDKEHQKRISLIPSLIDERIMNNRAICSDLEAMAKLLYDYWFVQFDFPDKNGKPYKSSGGKLVWSEQLKREIPEGWKATKLGNACSVLLGGTPDTSKEDYWNGDIPWLNSGEVANSPVLSSEKAITNRGLENSATAFAHAGAVVMSITRYIRPSILGIDACFNQSVVAIIPTEELHTSYLYPLMKSNVDKYMSLRTGAQQPHINKDIVEDTDIICPSYDVLNKYYQQVDTLYEYQKLVAMESQELKSLRDFLLPMLMNGQVRVNA